MKDFSGVETNMTKTGELKWVYGEPVLIYDGEKYHLVKIMRSKVVFSRPIEVAGMMTSEQIINITTTQFDDFTAKTRELE